MRTLSIRNRILASFSLILLVVAGLGAIIYSRIATVEGHGIGLRADSVPGLYQSSLIRDALARDYLMLATQVIEPDPAVKARSEGPIANQQALIDRLIADYERRIVADSDRDTFSKFKIAYADYRQTANGLLGETMNVNDLQAVKRRILFQFEPKYGAALKAIGDVSLLDQQRSIATLDEIDGELSWLLTGVAISFLLALAVASIAGFTLLRAITLPLRRLGLAMDAMRQGDFTQRLDIHRQDELGDLADGFNRMADEVMALVGQVQKSGIRVSTSMTEIAATSKQQQATASEVAATTTQIGVTSREIAATSRELVRTMTDVTAVAEQAAGLASSGQSGLAHMEETMGLVMAAAGSINAKLAVLNEKAGDINQVVTTITKVADQTNLLSLNAAIEAEKAGEYGRGFAVVSSEIRRLADQTAVATYDIDQMVKEIQAAVSAGVMGMDKFSEEVRRGLHDVNEVGAKLSDVITQVQTLAPRFETVSEGMQAQATGAEQISEALVQLTEATQQTVESLRQSSSAIDELNQVSGNLHGSISRFKLAAA
jgi:methyl-accepting chemotaxis protein WspA